MDALFSWCCHFLKHGRSSNYWKIWGIYYLWLSPHSPQQIIPLQFPSATRQNKREIGKARPEGFAVLAMWGNINVGGDRGVRLDLQIFEQGDKGACADYRRPVLREARTLQRQSIPLLLRGHRPKQRTHRNVLPISPRTPSYRQLHFQLHAGLNRTGETWSEGSIEGQSSKSQIRKLSLLFPPHLFFYHFWYLELCPFYFPLFYFPQRAVKKVYYVFCERVDGYVGNWFAELMAAKLFLICSPFRPFISSSLSPDRVYSDPHPSVRTAERYYLAIVNQFVKQLRLCLSGRAVWKNNRYQHLTLLIIRYPSPSK